MLEKLSNVQRGLLISLIFLPTVVINYYFYTDGFLIINFCMTIGFSLGFYLFFGNKLLPYIFLSVLLSHFIARILFIDETFVSSFYMSFALSFINSLVIFVLGDLIDLFNIRSVLTIKSIIIFGISAMFVSLFASTLTTLLFITSDSNIDIYDTMLNLNIGYNFGILIFGVPIMLSFNYDESLNNKLYSYKQFIYEFIYITSFILVASTLFSNTLSGFRFEHYSFIFIIFYIIVAFVFSFRMILIINILFAILFQYFFIKIGSVDGYSFFLFRAYLYLLILAGTSSILKIILSDLNLKNTALVKSTQKLESLVYSTESLLKLSDDILNTEVNIYEDYLSRIFKIVCNIFDNYDYASCFIKEDPNVKFIDAIGYDIETLMSFEFKSDKIDFIDTENPSHIVNEDKSVMSTLEEKYEAFTDIYPKMSESIRFGIYIDKDTIGGISFDISKNSGKKFVNEQFENLKSFQKLMNSFFSINYLNYKNISLKNDIVLSLIRTLELFDQYTGGHSEEVAHLSNEIAKRCGLNEYEMHDIYWAGVVHDIGKVGIDSTIINKPAKLSLDEYDLIKQHSMFGYEILNKAEDLRTIAKLVKHHHEWWNGTGYPDGLKGDDIPIGSQILSVCDAVSTMAKKRPYTIVKTSRQIIEELEMYSGVQFSPEPVKHMIDFIKEGLLDEFYKKR